MRFDIITIFPESFHGYLWPRCRQARSDSWAASDRAARSAQLHARPASHRRRPALRRRRRHGAQAGTSGRSSRIIWDLRRSRNENGTRESVILLSAQGAKFTQATARELAQARPRCTLCGRYEGVDERVNELVCDQRALDRGLRVFPAANWQPRWSLDATMRLLPGVLGNDDSSAFRKLRAGGRASSKRRGPALSSTHGAGGIAGLSALHTPGRVSRAACARGACRRQP